MTQELLTRDASAVAEARTTPAEPTSQQSPSVDAPLRRDRTRRGIADDGPGAVPTPPGWYPDPADTGGLRWWTGLGWSDHVSGATLIEPGTGEASPGHPDAPAAASSQVEPTVPMASAERAISDERTGRREHETAGAEPGPGPQGPPVRRRDPRRSVSVFTPLAPSVVHTWWIWLLAVLPLVVAAGEHGIAVSTLDPPTATVRISGLLAVMALSVVLAYADRARLRSGWHSDTASPLWALLSPAVYLVVRSVRVRQETGSRSSGPLLVWFLLVLPLLAIELGWDADTAIRMLPWAN